MIDATVTNLGALSGEVVLAAEDGVPPDAGEQIQSSKGALTVRVAWRIPQGIFLSYDGPALVVGDTVELEQQ